MEKNLLDLVAKVEFMKMGSPQEIAQCVSWFTETKSDMQAQWQVRCKHGKEPPARSYLSIVA